MIDSTVVRAHHPLPGRALLQQCPERGAAGAKGGLRDRGFGRSRGGFTTKIHALLRDIAYAQLTQDRLVRLHKGAAGVLKSRSGTRPILIAEHLAASGQHSEAIGQFLQAASITVGRAANLEVIDMCNRVIAMSGNLPAPPEQLGAELNARIQMGVAMQALYGYSAPDVLENYRKARDLCEIAGACEELFPVLRGLYVYNLLAGNLREAYRLALQLIDMADRTGTREHFHAEQAVNLAGNNSCRLSRSGAS